MVPKSAQRSGHELRARFLRRISAGEDASSCGKFLVLAGKEPSKQCPRVTALACCGVSAGLDNMRGRLSYSHAEQFFIQEGIILVKFWLEVGKKEQKRRFEARIEEPLRQWKLSPSDVQAYSRWYAYSRARDLMLEATDTESSPWSIVRSDDKRRARLNCIAHAIALPVQLPS